MKVALMQYESKNGDIEFNLSQLELGLAACAGKADLIVFSESFLQGFCSLTFDFEHDRRIAVPRDGEVFARIRAMTQDFGAALLFGYFELDGDSIYSSCAVVDCGRIIANYRRISESWKEESADAHYKEGALCEEFTFRGRAFKIALCGDMWVCPEHFKTDGVLIWPCYLNFPPDEWRDAEGEYAAQSLLAARHALMVDPLSAEPECAGGTFVFENGAVAAKLKFGTEGILFADI